MAPEISIAIKNALSYEEISQFNVRLKHEVEKATDKLRKANSRLREIDKQKDEFVSIASHELRTPMTSIKGYLWLALNRHQNELSEELKHKLEISYNSSERLIHMVNDMLTISRIEKNKIELNTEKIDLVPLLQQLYDELKIQADQKGIKFELVKGKDSYLVEGDKDKLREVFQNLLGNALKFVQEGYVKIILKQDKDKVFVKIEDTGPGIPEEEQDKLFQKFGKGKHAYRQQSNIEGTGLGLYISSKVISLHGGKIDVESELDKGTTFIVVLPVCSNNDKK
jgi:signal transduction histidine kinase